MYVAIRRSVILISYYFEFEASDRRTARYTCFHIRRHHPPVSPVVNESSNLIIAECIIAFREIIVRRRTERPPVRSSLAVRMPDPGRDAEKRARSPRRAPRNTNATAAGRLSISKLIRGHSSPFRINYGHTIGSTVYRGSPLLYQFNRTYQFALPSQNNGHAEKKKHTKSSEVCLNADVTDEIIVFRIFSCIRQFVILTV